MTTLILSKLNLETLASLTEAAFELRNALTDMERDLVDLRDKIDEANGYREALEKRHQAALDAFGALSPLCGDKPTTLKELVAYLTEHPNVTHSTWERGNAPQSLAFVEHRDRQLWFREVVNTDTRVRFNAEEVWFRPDGFRIKYYGVTHLFAYADAPVYRGPLDPTSCPEP